MRGQYNFTVNVCWDSEKCNERERKQNQNPPTTPSPNVDTFQSPLSPCASPLCFSSALLSRRVGFAEAPAQMLCLGNVGGKNEQNLLTYLPLLQLCFVPESFQPPSSDALLPQKKGREKFLVISVF
jgi:hypothetical protein